ncbi:hypothetical protein [Natrinema versiforme]|uniref:hypothetical protein n=1 Tax=Natrinema versiforme TaxID=88724 RepID=UPI0015867A56|nr:hypothetical protein [Natrinema versiforme]
MVLTTAGQSNGSPESDALYFTHPETALTRWAARSLANWENLRDYTDRAHDEWRYRWDLESTEPLSGFGTDELLHRLELELVVRVLSSSAGVSTSMWFQILWPTLVQ